MKLRLLPIVAFLLVVGLLGCRPERVPTSSVNPRQMAFAQAGMALVVGEEWECHDGGSERALYPPTLVSPAGRILVLLLPPDRAEPALVADGLRTAFEHNPAVAKHSFRQQQFTSDHGVQGLRVSYLQQVNGGAAVVENSHYLVKNRAGRCVVINYLASAEGLDTSAIRRMIQSSLSLQ